MKKLKKSDYRHYICVGITIAFLLISIFVFPHALGRVIEGIRDFFVSLGYYFCELFRIPYNFNVTVNEFPKYPFFSFLENYKSPTTTLPQTLNEFSAAWSAYWQRFASAENLVAYLVLLLNLLYYICNAILIIVPFFAIAFFLIHRYLTTQNNDYNKDSKPLIKFKAFTKKIYLPVKTWFKNFIYFIRENKAYWIIWLCLWLYNFNAFTIALELLAYYFYFVISFDLTTIYIQLYKLALDLWAVLDFVPFWAWVIIAIVALDLFCKSIAMLRLRHYERCNCGFINERGVVTIVYGAMGCGKTTQITDMALSTEVQFRNQAYEIILECDMHFPNFPWIELELQIKHLCESHELYDLPSVRGFIRKLRDDFCSAPSSDSIFNYDYEGYGLIYNDNLKSIDIWHDIEDYACAYFIYTVQSALLVSNYSIRTDSLMQDLGNFPLWNSDFFKRDSRLLDSYSRHAHILDFDMLRLGKKMLDDNPNKNAFGFGVYIISEIDKERKNTPELKEVKASSDTCNQKNDLFNVLLKMSRHACVVSNRVFIKVFADLQRPTSLGADALDLGEIVEIKAKGDLQPALPFFSPFYLFDLLYCFIKSRFNNFYAEYRFNRGDNTLLLYLFKGLVAKMSHYEERINNLYGCQTLSLEVESGTRDGEVLKRKYYRMPKKIYSNRYSTDCLSGIFEVRAINNNIGLDDLMEYADIMATNDELGLQNSHFQTEINALNAKD